MPRAIWTRAHESAQQDKGPTIGIIGNEHTSVATQQRPCTERARHLFSGDRCAFWRRGSWRSATAESGFLRRSLQLPIRTGGLRKSWLRLIGVTLRRLCTSKRTDRCRELYFFFSGGGGGGGGRTCFSGSILGGLYGRVSCTFVGGL